MSCACIAFPCDCEEFNLSASGPVIVPDTESPVAVGERAVGTLHLKVLLDDIDHVHRWHNSSDVGKAIEEAWNQELARNERTKTTRVRLISWVGGPLGYEQQLAGGAVLQTYRFDVVGEVTHNELVSTLVLLTLLTAALIDLSIRGGDSVVGRVVDVTANAIGKIFREAGKGAAEVLKEPAKELAPWVGAALLLGVFLVFR